MQTTRSTLAVAIAPETCGGVTRERVFFAHCTGSASNENEIKPLCNRVCRQSHVEESRIANFGQGRIFCAGDGKIGRVAHLIVSVWTDLDDVSTLGVSGASRQSLTGRVIVITARFRVCTMGAPFAHGAIRCGGELEDLKTARPGLAHALCSSNALCVLCQDNRPESEMPFGRGLMTAQRTATFTVARVRRSACRRNGRGTAG